MRQLTNQEKASLRTMRLAKGTQALDLIREMVAIAYLLEMDELRPYEQALVDSWKEVEPVKNPGKELAEFLGIEKLVSKAVHEFPVTAQDLELW